MKGHFSSYCVCYMFPYVQYRTFIHLLIPAQADKQFVHYMYEDKGQSPTEHKLLTSFSMSLSPRPRRPAASFRCHQQADGPLVSPTPGWHQLCVGSLQGEDRVGVWGMTGRVRRRRGIPDNPFKKHCLLVTSLQLTL